MAFSDLLTTGGNLLTRLTESPIAAPLALAAGALLLKRRSQGRAQLANMALQEVFRPRQERAAVQQLLLTHPELTSAAAPTGYTGPTAEMGGMKLRRLGTLGQELPGEYGAGVRGTQLRTSPEAFNQVMANVPRGPAAPAPIPASFSRYSPEEQRVRESLGGFPGTPEGQLAASKMLFKVGERKDIAEQQRQQISTLTGAGQGNMQVSGVTQNKDGTLSFRFGPQKQRIRAVNLGDKVELWDEDNLAGGPILTRPRVMNDPFERWLRIQTVESEAKPFQTQIKQAEDFLAPYELRLGSLPETASELDRMDLGSIQVKNAQGKVDDARTQERIGLIKQSITKRTQARQKIDDLYRSAQAPEASPAGIGTLLSPAPAGPPVSAAEEELVRQSGARLGIPVPGTPAQGKPAAGVPPVTTVPPALAPAAAAPATALPPVAAVGRTPASLPQAQAVVASSELGPVGEVLNLLSPVSAKTAVGILSSLAQGLSQARTPEERAGLIRQGQEALTPLIRQEQQSLQQQLIKAVEGNDRATASRIAAALQVSGLLPPAVKKESYLQRYEATAREQAAKRAGSPPQSLSEMYDEAVGREAARRKAIAQPVAR